MDNDGDYDAVLRAAERLRTALARLCEYLESGTHHQPPHDPLVKEVEAATEEFWRHWVNRRAK